MNFWVHIEVDVGRAVVESKHDRTLDFSLGQLIRKEPKPELEVSSVAKPFGAPETQISRRREHAVALYHPRALTTSELRKMIPVGENLYGHALN